MLYRELTAKHGIKTRQCGDKVIAMVKIIDDDTIRMYGFEVVDYQRYEPKTLRLLNSYDVKSVEGWNQAYDMLFGKPVAPDFTKVLNV